MSLVGVWVSDYAWLEYRIGHDTAGQAFGSVTFYYATLLKNGRTEIFYDQPQTEVCVQSLFPHSGYRPCWYAVKSCGIGAPGGRCPSPGDYVSRTGPLMLAIPSGRMLSEGRDYLREAWWISTFPGLGIMLTVLAMNLLGDGLRDVLDPRL